MTGRGIESNETQGVLAYGWFHPPRRIIWTAIENGTLKMVKTDLNFEYIEERHTNESDCTADSNDIKYELL